ncbi:MAG TPA: PmoA family protein [Acidobacteriaceae bacterium]|nr:PmoA family protein [Acidobacteriaceae bacterium]
MSKRALLSAGIILLSSITLVAQPKSSGKGMQVIPNEAERRVDITYNGQPFTSYVWPTSLKKPVLYPLIAPGGEIVSRGFPLQPRPGERVDHPHHAGMWFNYGNVNGFDFWNNSDAIKPENRDKMGTIHQQRIVSSHSGRDTGDLTVETVWTDGKGQDLIQETTHFTFTHRPDANVIDRVTTLKALDPIVFHDDKEGMLGIRVAHFMESPTEKGGMFSDASGRVTKVADADTKGATGVYLTSEGKQGDAAWGTRGRWCLLSGQKDGQTYTIGIYDHPGNPGYPTYWHARGYGLFAANPLGDSIFDKNAKPHNFAIDKDGTATFRYRVILYKGGVTAADANREADAFAAAE